MRKVKYPYVSVAQAAARKKASPVRFTKICPSVYLCALRGKMGRNANEGSRI